MCILTFRATEDIRRTSREDRPTACPELGGWDFRKYGKNCSVQCSTESQMEHIMHSVVKVWKD